MRTRLSLRSTSVMANLFERDIFGNAVENSMNRESESCLQNCRMQRKKMLALSYKEDHHLLLEVWRGEIGSGASGPLVGSDFGDRPWWGGARRKLVRCGVARPPSSSLPESR